jgi:hypothetical protein
MDLRLLLAILLSVSVESDIEGTKIPNLKGFRQWTNARPFHVTPFKAEN